MNGIEKIFITRLKFMGDVILTLPVVHNLKRAFPDASITYLAAKPYHQLLFHNPDIDKVIGFDLENISQQFPVISSLIKNKFDIALDLFGNPRTAVLSYLTGARIRIGGDFRGRRIFYTHRINNNGLNLSSIDFHLNYLKPLGIEPEFTQPKIFISSEERLWAKEYLEKIKFNNKPIVGIHAGATWPAKKWHASRFGELARMLMENLGVQVFFTAGPYDIDLVSKIIKDYSLDVNTPEVLNIRQLCSVIERFSVFISNDCGPMHIAPAVGVPTIGIFGPGRPDIWFPYSEEKGHRAIFKTLWCSRCGRDFCDDLKCMDAVSTEDVYNAASEILEKNGKKE